MTNQSTRIARARRQAKRQGLVLRKMRGYEDGYLLINPIINCSAIGGSLIDEDDEYPPLVDLLEVEVYLAEHDVRICHEAVSPPRYNPKHEMTREEAEYAVEDIWQRRGEALGVYECPKPGARHYHIGHVPKAVLEKA